MKILNAFLMTGLMFVTMSASHAQTYEAPTSLKTNSTPTLDLNKLNKDKLIELLKNHPELFDGEGGHTVGNGGDAIEQDGELVLRDFLDADSSLVQVDDSRKFAESIPEFKALVAELMKAHSLFGLAVWNQITQNQIWVTEAELPLLPAAATAVVGAKAQVQVAIRYGNRIVISLPAFHKVDRASILLHEALHGLVFEKGAWLHESVRAIVRSVKAMDGQMTYEKLQQLAGKYNMNTVTNSNKREAMNLSELLLRTDMRKERCAIIATNENLSYGTYGTLPDALNFLQEYSIRTWSDYASCDDKKSVTSIFEEKLPILNESAPFLYVPTVYYQTGFLGVVSDYTKKQCAEFRKYNSEKRISDARNYLARIKTARSSLLQQKAATKNRIEIMIIDIGLANSYPLHESRIADVEKSLEKAQAQFGESSRLCTNVN